MLKAENYIVIEMRLKLQLCSAVDMDQLHKCYIIAPESSFCPIYHSLNQAAL